MLIGSAAVLLFKQSIPFARTWLYLVPFAAVAADAGLSYAMKAVAQKAQFLLPVLLLALALRSTVTMISEDTIASGADFPEAARIVQDLKAVMRPGDVVHVKIPIDWSTYFYMWYFSLPHVIGMDAQPRNEFFIVEKRSYSITDLTHRPVTLVAERGGGLLYRLAAVTCDASDPANGEESAGSDDPDG